MFSSFLASRLKRRAACRFLKRPILGGRTRSRDSRRRKARYHSSPAEALEPRTLLSGTGFEAHFDFGTPASPVADGYQQVLANTDYSAARGHGWQSGSIDARNRSASLGSDLSRDFNFTNQGIFAVDVPEDGTYLVTLVMGDGVGFVRDQMGIFLEGQHVASVTASGGDYAVSAFHVTVSDGQLNVMFQDMGGVDPLVMINALDVELVESEPQDQTGPQIVSIETGETGDGTIDRYIVTFSEEIDPTSVSLNGANLFGPDGFVAPLSVNMLDAFSVEFVYPPPTVSGLYTLTVLPVFTDLAGNFVDQDGDGIGGEIGDDFETFDADVEVVAPPPDADAGGGYEVEFGGHVQLDGSGSSGGNLVYTWDLDGDGIFGETGTDAAFGDEVGARPVFNAAGLAGGTQWTVALRVTDELGRVSEDSATIDVQHAAPELTDVGVNSHSWWGRSVAVVRGKFTGNGGSHVVTVDWGDGTTSVLRDREYNGRGCFFGGHRYRSGGTFEVRVTVTDEHGASATSVHSVTAAGIRLQDGVLSIVGTERRDRVTIQRVRGGYFKITANFLPRGRRYVRAANVDRIEIETHGGNDRVKLVGSLGVEVDFDGGEGNDRLVHRRWSGFNAFDRCFSSRRFHDHLFGFRRSCRR